MQTPTPTPLPPPPATATSAAPPPEALSLPFEELPWKDGAEAETADLTIPSADDDRFTLGTEQAVAEPALPAAPMAPPAEFDDAIDFPDASEEVLVDDDVLLHAEPGAPEPRKPGAVAMSAERGRMNAILLFLALTLGLYAGLTRTLIANPALCDSLVARVPLVGSFGDERVLRRKVALTEVSGSYQRIKDGRDVLVITGKAFNTAQSALHSVQIVTRLLDAGGHEVDQRVIYCGNVISAKLLKDLTPREVSVLQKLSPPRRFVIEPGEASPFVVVFMDPPRQAGEFSTQVASVQRQT